ncbi:MAG: alanine/ornithine racemase family PLP-dependent enzyme [Clostridiales Family XIII bacterium]|jgi:predicted amino acid racemase|nr:alanine/ornithine racemase family PLP-dependent enzyme [Clostridiales Family XIII bacterium]
MYPRLEINTEKLRKNAETVTALCAARGIAVSGVVKVVSGNVACAHVMAEAGCASIASSRLEQLERLRDSGLSVPLMLIRIPMKSEVPALVRTAEISLNSDLDVLRLLNEEAGRIGRTHQVILMIDLGDLREGFWSAEEYVAAAVCVERELPHLHLLGVGTNLGCYGSICPTAEKLAELVEAAERVEAAIGRKLQIISGGASTSFLRVIAGDIPERINHLRIGEGILVNRDNEDLYGFVLEGTHRDVFVLKAEVVEVRTKPSHPIGEIMFDAFRNKPTYEDRGDRKRALLAVGKVDYGYADQIYPRVAGTEVLGASSDHTILDIEDAEREIRVGDVLEFDVNYAAVAYLTSSDSVRKRIISQGEPEC